MNRKEITAFLEDILIKTKFLGIGKYWAKEVSIDACSSSVRRVDFMQFEPNGVCGISAIEKGIFICYEIKSCKADFDSGFGRNFIGEKNYYVMTMDTYKDVINEIPRNVGVLVPIPDYADVHEEFETPTKLSPDIEWKLYCIRKSIPQIRKRSMVELLFCMLRSCKKL